MSPRSVSKGIALGWLALAGALAILRLASPSHGLGLGTIVGALILLAGAALFASFGLWRSREQNVGLQLAAGVVLVALVLLEAVGQASAGTNQMDVRDGQLVTFDRRSLAEYIIDKRRAGEQVYGYFNPVYFGLEGITGISDARVAYCNESGTYDEFETDAFGFRDPPGMLATPGYQPKLAILGDSFALGCGARTGQTIADILRDRVEPTTYNAAVGGSGPLQQFAVLTEYLEGLRPRTVLWFYFEGNDLWNLQNELQIPYLRHYFDGGASRDLVGARLHLREVLTSWHDESLANSSRPLRVAQQAEPQATPWGRIEGLLERSIIFRSVRSVISIPAQRSRPVDLLLDRYSEILLKARNLIGGWGGDLYVVYVPELARYTTVVNLDPTSYRDFRERVLARLERDGLQVLDLVEAFRQAGVDPRTLYPSRMGTDVHLNAAGNALAADHIIRDLSRRQPGPSR